MKGRKLNTNEHKNTRQLWENVFKEDGKAFLDYYYELVADHNQIYGIEMDGEIQSMLHLNPYTVQINEQQREVNYIVGVATGEEFRRQGYMGELLRTSMREMYCKGEPFTFLMPAAESIYSPYDFVTICNQCHYQYEGNLDEAGLPLIKGYELSYAEKKDCRDIVELAMNIIANSYAVYTIRDTSYYERLIKEQQCQNGGIALIRKNGTMVGYFITAKEELLQVRELILMKEHAAFKELMPLEVKEMPKIMIRIINLKELFTCLRIKDGFEAAIAVFDPIIGENTGIYQLQGTSEGVRCNKSSAEVNRDTAIPISALARVVFGLENLEGWPACDSLSPVLLNEIV